MAPQLAVFNILDTMRQGSRYLRRDARGSIGAALDLSIIPSFPSAGVVAGLAATPSTTGGTLGAATYPYQVTAYTVRGETLPQAAVNATTTGTTGSVALAWTQLAPPAGTPPVLGYNIYRGGLYLASVLGASTVAYVDTGALVPAGAINAVDTTSLIQNAVAGQINAGDMVYRTANGVASLNNPGTGNANAASFLGVSEDTYPQNLGLGLTGGGLTRPSTDTMSVRIAIRTGGEFAMDTTPGETYRPGDLLYLGADAQTVSKVAVGTSVGTVADDQSPVLAGSDGFSVPIVGGPFMGGGASLPGGTQGQRVNVYIKPPLAA